MDIRSLIRTVPDFPKPGIGYKDITPVLGNAEALKYVVDDICGAYDGKIDAVVGIESRGFILGGPIAYALGLGLVIVRKPGKLPHDSLAVEYELEYGTDTLEMHVDSLSPGARVLVVDDLLATGGTAAAALELVLKVGGNPVGCAFMIELAFLGGAARLAPVSCRSLVRYDD
ncbi:MAG: adenine phosphoribosyltransferase [Hyphomicrobiaceae bacterium]|jgi:adenine phosphoribosyltransferase